MAIEFAVSDGPGTLIAHGIAEKNILVDGAVLISQNPDGYGFKASSPYPEDKKTVVFAVCSRNCRTGK